MLAIARAHIQVCVVVFFEVLGCCGEHKYAGRHFDESDIVKGKVVMSDGVNDVDCGEADNFFIKGELHHVGGICRGKKLTQPFLTYNAFPKPARGTFQAHGFDCGAQYKLS